MFLFPLPSVGRRIGRSFQGVLLGVGQDQYFNHGRHGSVLPCRCELQQLLNFSCCAYGDSFFLARIHVCAILDYQGQCTAFVTRRATGYEVSAKTARRVMDAV